MAISPDRLILSSRNLKAPLDVVYRAFADPDQLRLWWGPEGFTNTIHEFDLRPGGRWLLTMHGPEKGHYENASTFTRVEPSRLVAWTRSSRPLFDMAVGFERVSDQETRITFRMMFPSAGECAKVRSFAGPKNEENFDRLEAVLSRVGPGHP